MTKNKTWQETIKNEGHLMLHPDVNPSISPKSVIRDIQQPIQTGSQIIAKLQRRG